MVGRGAKFLPQQQGRTRIRGGARDDFLEQLWRHTARAGKSRKQAARAQELQRVEVDVLVAASRARRVLRRRRELRGIEHDEVELPSLAPQPAQGFEDIRLLPFDAPSRCAAEAEIALRQRERLS